MSCTLRRTDYFPSDFDHRYRWYLAKAGEDVARRYFDAVWQTLEQLAQHPGIGRSRRFRHPALRGLRSFPVQPPFAVHLIFYRHTDRELSAERLMHGHRDLPRRLREPRENPAD